jgi:hypothetical protein
VKSVKGAFDYANEESHRSIRIEARAEAKQLQQEGKGLLDMVNKAARKKLIDKEEKVY